VRAWKNVLQALERFQPGDAVPHGEGMTAAELAELARARLAAAEAS
jgi:hypothetical protein